MHGYTDSLDSSVNIRTNPLNIHMDDGSDLVIGNPSPSQFVSTAKPSVVRGRTVSSQSQSAEQVYEAANTSLLSIHEPVQPLKILKQKQQVTHSSVQESTQVDEVSAEETAQVITQMTLKPSAPLDEHTSLAELSIPEFSPLITSDLDTFSLTRQGTIRSKAANASTGPSKSTELFKRIRSFRSSQPDTDADSPLPANLLKVIQFSPLIEGGWRANSLGDSEDVKGNLETVSNSDTGSISGSIADSLAHSPAISESTLASSTQSASNLKVASPNSAHSDNLTPGGSKGDSALSSRLAPPAQHSPNVCAASMEMSDQEAMLISATPDLAETDPISEDDRGRLFMQIRKLQGLRGVPIDSSRNPRFTITLDNGLQSVTTPPQPLPCSQFTGTIQARIGQEFELTVGRDLELVMTLNLLMDSVQPPPKPRTLGAQSEAENDVETGEHKTPPTTPKQSRVKSFFSPKRKHKHQSRLSLKQEVKKQDEQIQLQREHDAQMAEYRKRRDLWKNHTGPGGEYARGYLFESHYERDIYGKAEVYSLPLYNEWQGEEAKHMGDLELTLMFIPRLYGSEQLPQSLAQAQRDVQAAQLERQFDCSGYLTQNGGDCKMYRRRYFTLNGNEFIAHHEATHKVRAVIHMENALEVVDCEHVTPNDNMWCIYDDRSFLLVFNDGEEVSFYADTPELKTRWVQALIKSMTFSAAKTRTWKDLVLDSFEANK